MSWTFELTQAGYGNLWRSATIRPEDEASVTAAARKIIANEQRYRVIQETTGVPWFWWGAICHRESNQNFNAHPHNGDPLSGYTFHGPANRPQVGHPPPFTWEESSIDAIRLKNLDDVERWSVEQMLFRAELYNGTGYVGKKVRSPYLWAATSLQQLGKYVSDGTYDPNHWDQQLGVAAILKRMGELRPDIAAALFSETAPIVRPPVREPIPLPAPIPPSMPEQGIDLQQLQQWIPLLISLIQMLSGRAGQQIDLTPIVTRPAEPLPPRPPDPPAPPVEPVKPTPILEKPSVQLSAGALGISTLLQSLGILGSPAGIGPLIGADPPTTAGTLATVIPIITGLIGTTSGWGTLFNLARGLFSRRT